MPKHKPTPEPMGRYSMQVCRMEIVARLRAGGRGAQAELARGLGLTPNQLTKRLGGETDLTIGMIGAIADRLRAPPGWPFIPWHIAEAAFGRAFEK